MCLFHGVIMVFHAYHRLLAFWIMPPFCSYWTYSVRVVGSMFSSRDQQCEMYIIMGFMKRYNHCLFCWNVHYSGMIMSAMTSQIIGVSIVWLTICPDADKKHQSSVSLAFVRGIHRWPANSPYKWPVTRKRFLLDDVIMWYAHWTV